MRQPAKTLTKAIYHILRRGIKWDYATETTPVKGDDSNIIKETIKVTMGLDTYEFIKTVHHTETTQSTPKYYVKVQIYDNGHFTEIYNQDKDGIKVTLITAIKTLMEVKIPTFETTPKELSDTQEEHRVILEIIELVKKEGSHWSAEDSVNTKGRELTTVTGHLKRSIFNFWATSSDKSYAMSVNINGQPSAVLYAPESVSSLPIDYAIKDIMEAKLYELVREKDYWEEENKIRVFDNLRTILEENQPTTTTKD